MAMHSYNIVLYLKWPFLQFFSGITVVNNIILLITQNCSSVAQASSSFKCLDTATMLKYIILPLNCSTPSCYLCTTVLMILTVNTAACTVLAYAH